METISLIEHALGRDQLISIPCLLDQFKIYQELLLEWNKKMNLVSKRDEVRLITRHFLQSAGIVTAIGFPSQSTVLDLGSGAGFPGIPIKLLRPDLRLLLVESNQKRASFLTEAVKVLGFENAVVFHGRAENSHLTLKKEDSVVSRAVADLVVLLRWSQPFFTRGGGRLVVLKGGSVYQEIDRIKEKNQSFGVRKYHVMEYNPFPQVFQLNNSFLVNIEL